MGFHRRSKGLPLAALKLSGTEDSGSGAR
ncbi:MAG: hypothetical protein JWQ11_379, partial [Rhizobacter sp.]|nr:hypothetical protein [Rhizobacter sp.]